ncbi:MAG: thermonuclease family protein [Myxococcales bacterium]|nr:thermonuclease family protein [Myxococcales bacterium]
MFIPLYEALDGWILLPGYAPDGDSVRFFAKEPARFEALRRSRLLRRGATDGSVQLRLEGIDAPELHYAQACQPRGESARDALLAWLGVTGVQFAADATTIIAATPPAVPVTLLANAVDAHGRVIAYVLPPRQGARAKRHRATPELVRTSATHAMLEGGHVYPLAYTSMPEVHRKLFRDVARRARAKRVGIWRDDATKSGFVLHGARSVGPHGALILPKLFRRCMEFLTKRYAESFTGTFLEWLASHGSGGAPKPDRVVLRHAANVPLSSLLHSQSPTLSLRADLTELIFVES